MRKECCTLLTFDMVPSIMLRILVASLLAVQMSRKGLKQRSLSRSGAVAAFIVGMVHMSCGYTFGLVLIAFYLTSSKLTKLNQKRKAALDASVKLGGQRGMLQVFSNSAGGCVAAAVAFAATVWSSSSSAQLVQLLAWVAFLGHYSCCCADTWASELGMLSSTPPRLITTGRPVPPGTNGGVTLLGVSAGAAGGLFMGLVVWGAGCISREATTLVGVISTLLQKHPHLQAQGVWQCLPFWLLVGSCAGVVGSFTDSVLGASVQYSGWCNKTQKVVAQRAPHVQHISGLPILSNNAVNVLSALLTSAGSAAVILYLARRNMVL